MGRAMQHNSSDYRMMAAMCAEIANGMPLDTDRLRLTDRAQEWLELARETEAAQLPKIADAGSVQSSVAQTQTGAKSRTWTDSEAEGREMADDAGPGTVATAGTPRSQFGEPNSSAGERGGHHQAAGRSPGAVRAWSLLGYALLPLLAVLALLLAALFAWSP